MSPLINRKTVVDQPSKGIRKVAVLGSGTMGSRIAAHIANAGYPVLLLDVADGDGRDRSSVSRRGLEALKKARPEAFTDASVASLITIGNFEDDLDLLKTVDWVIEAVAEQMSIKRDLLARVAPHLRADAILTTNTSGLPITDIAEILPASLRARFFGSHFFNPPRYMALLELIGTPQSNPAALKEISTFAEVHLGKTVVPAKDRPNFIANRIGTFTLLNTMRIKRQQGLFIEEIDALTGTPLGWPKTGTFRLADLIGIDVLVHVARNFSASVCDERSDVTIDPALDEMLVRKWLGDKTGQGFYKKERDRSGAETRSVLNLATWCYEPEMSADIPELANIKKSDPPAKRIPTLLRGETESGKAGSFYWAILSELFIYAANRIGEVSDSVADIDLAMQTGFNWENGPFAMWDAAGVPETVARMRRLNQPVPASVETLLQSGHSSWYRNEGSEYFDPGTGTYLPVRVSPRILSLTKAKRAGLVRSNSSVSLVDIGSGAACIEVHSKMNSLGSDVVAFFCDTLGNDSNAVRDFDAFVIGSDAAHFSAGANLAELAALIQSGEWNTVELFLTRFQAMTTAIKFCSKPVVAAPFGMCLGGGAEIAMHAASRQAYVELSMGLVETGVGLIPGGGGCKEMTLRAIERAADVQPDPRGDSAEIHKTLGTAFDTIAMAKVSSSALNAKGLHLLRASDRITMNRTHLLADAKAEALRLAEQGYSAPILRTDLPAPGKPALALLENKVRLLREGEFISDHDVLVCKHLARILCGGPITAGTPMSESYLLRLEHEAFLSLCGEPKTQERIAFTLKTGKPLRN